MDTAPVKLVSTGVAYAILSVYSAFWVRVWCAHRREFYFNNLCPHMGIKLRSLVCFFIGSDADVCDGDTITQAAYKMWIGSKLDNYRAFFGVAAHICAAFQIYRHFPGKPIPGHDTFIASLIIAHSLLVRLRPTVLSPRKADVFIILLVVLLGIRVMHGDQNSSVLFVLPLATLCRYIFSSLMFSKTMRALVNCCFGIAMVVVLP